MTIFNTQLRGLGLPHAPAPLVRGVNRFTWLLPEGFTLSEPPFAFLAFPDKTCSHRIYCDKFNISVDNKEVVAEWHCVAEPYGVEITPIIMGNVPIPSEVP